MHIRTGRPRGQSGFTVIELMVAIGAVAVISVGIAGVFAAVGRTVSGGRRVSNLNQYAALIERQMRADFDAMTRDGVLLIRHQEVNNRAGAGPQPVQLHPDDTDPRLRRADQIIFAVRGEFTSARTPLLPGVSAPGGEAMVHYGHGMRLDPRDDFGAAPAYELPEVDDGQFPPASGSAFREELGLGRGAEPNLYAADWTLCRWVRVLTPPASSQSNLPLPGDQVWGDLGLDPLQAVDSDIQVACQPAASSAFTLLAARFPSNISGYTFPARYIRENGPDRYPTFASGLVDVATTDLAEIRRVITDAAAWPWDVFREDQFFPGYNDPPLFDDRFSHSMGMGGDLRFIHAWMDDLFPTNPHPGITVPDQTDVRPRFEPAVPDFFGTITAYDADQTGTPPYEQNFRLADQAVLGSSVFIPNCSEFIVEYSFGQVVENDQLPYHGQLIWYGKERQLNLDGATYSVVRRYPYDTTDPDNELRPYYMPYKKLDGSTVVRPLNPGVVYAYPPLPDNEPDPDVLTAHFGFVDPFYTPNDPDVDPATIPWAWPKLIRVTISLADPNNPSVEQTYQFIFETPEADAH